MVKTKLQELQEKEKELEKRERVIRGAEMYLDEQRSQLNGFRDIDGFKGYYENIMQLKKIDRSIEFCEANIKFKKDQIAKNEIIEKNPNYEGGFRQDWELEQDIKTFKLQIEESKIQKIIVEKMQEILCSDKKEVKKKSVKN